MKDLTNAQKQLFSLAKRKLDIDLAAIDRGTLVAHPSSPATSSRESTPVTPVKGLPSPHQQDAVSIHPLLTTGELDSLFEREAASVVDPKQDFADWLRSSPMGMTKLQEEKLQPKSVLGQFLLTRWKEKQHQLTNLA